MAAADQAAAKVAAAGQAAAKVAASGQASAKVAAADQAAAKVAAADQAAAKVAAADQAAAKARTAVWVQAVRRIQATVAGRLTRQTWRELMQWMQVKMHGDGNRALKEQFLRDSMREQYEFVKQAIERRWRGKKGELDKIASQARRKANTQQDKADRARARDAAVQERHRSDRDRGQGR